MVKNELLATLHRWVHKGGFAILDQAFFSGANFAVSVVLARWLSPKDYGAFAFTFSIFLFIVAIHTAFFTEPMLTFGGKRFRADLPSYLGVLMAGHFLASVCIGILILGGSFLMGKHLSVLTGQTLLSLVFAAPAILLLWILRRVFYIRFEPGIAAIGGGFYFIFQIALLYFFYKAKILSPPMAFILMGISSLIVSIFYILIARPKLSLGEEFSYRAVFKLHWKYSRWAAATAGIAWLSSNLYFMILPAKFGLAVAGEFKAFTTVLMPAVQTNAVLSMLIVPYLAHASKSDHSRYKFSVRALSSFILVFNFIYFCLLAFFPKQILHLFFGGLYQDTYYFLPIYGATVVLGGLSAILGGSMRAIERPDATFWAQAGSAAFAILVGGKLAAHYGIVGAATGLLVSSLIFLSVVLVSHCFVRHPQKTT